MDVVTHTLVGVALARAGLRRRVGPGTTGVLVVASNLCDIDMLSAFAGASTAMFARRALSHSVFGLPLLCLVAAWAFSRWHRHMRLGQLFALCLLGGSVHIALDLLNAYGVALLAPISSRWFEMGVVFPVDPILTATLVGPVIAGAAWASGRTASGAQPGWRFGLALMLVYVGVCVWNRQAAVAHLAGYVQRQGLQPSATHVVPEPLGPHRWNGIIRSGAFYRTVLVHSIGGSVDAPQMIESMVDDARVLRVLEDRRAAWADRFFTAPVWRADGELVVVRDLRFTYQVLHNEWDPFRLRFRLTDDGVELQDWTLAELARGLQSLGRDVAAATGASSRHRPVGQP